MIILNDRLFRFCRYGCLCRIDASAIGGITDEGQHNIVSLAPSVGSSSFESFYLLSIFECASHK